MIGVSKRKSSLLRRSSLVTEPDSKTFEQYPLRDLPYPHRLAGQAEYRADSSSPRSTESRVTSVTACTHLSFHLFGFRVLCRHR